MIELKNLEISKSKKKNDKVNVMFPLGIYYLDSYSKHIFSFLLFDKELEQVKGQLLVDDVDLFSSEDSTFFSLKINSKFGSFYSFFVVDKNDKENQRAEIINAFQALKDLPHENEEQIKEKILALFNLYVEKNAKYICVDFNEVANKEHENIIIENMTDFQEKLTFICLKRKVIIKEDEIKKDNSSIKSNEEDELIEENYSNEEVNKENVETQANVTSLNFKGMEDHVEIDKKETAPLLEFDTFNIGFIAEEKENKPSEKKKKKNITKPIKKFVGFFNRNVLVSVLISFACLLIVLFSMLLIYSFKHSKLFDSILILLVTIISFSVSTFIQVSSFDFLKGKPIKMQKEKYVYTLVLIELSTFVGIALGYGIFALFYNLNFLLDSEKYIAVYSIVAIILSIVAFIVPLLAPIVLKIAKKVKLFFTSAGIKNK
ncbi:MAG: hypothetical protein ACI31G_04340 [Bacilli bacterium]